MLKLFKYSGYKLTISEEAMLLKPFRDLWERDTSEDKQVALQELGYVYFFCDPRSDYQYIVDENDRRKAIKTGEGMPKGWKPDKMVKDAIKFYLSFKPTSALLLEDTRVAVDKLRQLLREINLADTDDKGKPIYTLNVITQTIKQIPQLVKELDAAEKALTQELAQQGRMRGQGEKTIFEDGIEL